MLLNMPISSWSIIRRIQFKWEIDGSWVRNRKETLTICIDHFWVRNTDPQLWKSNRWIRTVDKLQATLYRKLDRALHHRKELLLQFNWTAHKMFRICKTYLLLMKELKSTRKCSLLSNPPIVVIRVTWALQEIQIYPDQQPIRIETQASVTYLLNSRFKRINYKSLMSSRNLYRIRKRNMSKELLKKRPYISNSWKENSRKHARKWKAEPSHKMIMMPGNKNWDINTEVKTINRITPLIEM